MDRGVGKWLQVRSRGLASRAGLVLSLVAVVLSACDTVTYRQFDYSDAEASVSGWQVGAGLQGSWTEAEGAEEYTEVRGSPYRMWLWIRGVSSSATVTFEDVVLTSLADSASVSVILEPPRWSDGAAGQMAESVATDLTLTYEDYVLSARVRVTIDDEVEEQFVQLLLNRAYSEERGNRHLERLQG
jgi:hypothetical protein